MWDALATLGHCLLVIVVVILPVVGIVKLIAWYGRYVERHGIQFDDDDDDDGPLDTWWQAPPPTFRP